MPAPLLLALLLAADPAAPAAFPREGDPVVEVRLEGSPELRRYVEIAPGEAFHSGRVRHAVELIHAAGAFEDVVVEGEAGEGGWRLVFRPVPAPRLRAVRVEGDRVMGARELRRLGRLRVRAPLWPETLAAAARAAQEALAERGWPEARVAVRTEPRPVPASSRPGLPLSDAVFTVSAGERLRVGRTRLAIEGEEAVPEGGTRLPSLRSVLEGRMRPRPGEAFWRSRARTAAEGMAQVLRARGRWLAAVEVKEGREGGRGQVDLTFEVRPGPSIGVAFRGDPVPARLASEVRRRLEDGNYQVDAREEGAERIEAELLAAGHRGAVVRQAEEVHPGRTLVVYDVRPGPASQVASVRLDGDPGHGLGALLSTRAGQPLLERRLEEDARSLTRALEEHGYSQASVEADPGEGAGAVPVTFRVRPGPRLHTASVRVEGLPGPSAAGDPAEEIVRRELHLAEGRPYRLRDLALDRRDLLVACRDAGYPGAEVQAETSVREDGGVDVVLRVEPGPLVRVEHVVVSGLDRTREVVVRRELRLAEGDPLGLEKLLESQRRLSTLGLFQRVAVTEAEGEEPTQRSLVVTVEEARPTTVAYGLGYGERDLFRGSVEVTRRNLLGMDRTLSLFGRLSFRGHRFLASYREPYLLGRHQQLFLTAFREDEERETFSFVRSGGILQTARDLRRGLSLILRYSFQDTSTYDVEVPCGEAERPFCDSRVSGPSVSVVHDTRDDPLDPRRGRFVGADVLYSTHLLGGHDFVKGFFQAAAYQRLASRLVLAVGARVGLARTLGLGEPLLMPLPELFFAGGDNTLRGFSTDSVRERGGNALLLGNGELRFDLSPKLGLAAFADVGNVYPLVSDLDLSDLRKSSGVGLRYRSPVGPVRLDWGFKLDRRPGESRSRLHVTVGHAF